MYFVYQFFKPLLDFFREIKIFFKIKKLSESDVKILNKYFYYYKNLNNKHKEEFKVRLTHFIASKKFIPRGGLKSIDRKMELLIGATAIMVIFGFRNVRLRHFSKILVYPDSYYSTINKAYHQGEVNPKFGIIVISWKNFLNGIKSKHDGVNLGVHEMAHALKLENQIHNNEESNFFNLEYWLKFQEMALIEMERINGQQASFFRTSAGKNIHEFFAVALESFFERPEAFKSYHENLYKSLIVLLRQDPIVLKS